MPTFEVTAHYCTLSGNHKSTRFEIECPDDESAFTLARTKIVNDKRRQYFGKLDMDAIKISDEPTEAEKLDAAYRQAATNKWYKEGEIEIDDPGAYVAAWVWVYADTVKT